MVTYVASADNYACIVGTPSFVPPHLPTKSFDVTNDAVLSTDDFRDGLASLVLGSGRMYAAFVPDETNFFFFFFYPPADGDK